jgi:hypothetical protein
MTATVMAVATVILLISALTWGLTDVNRVRPADFVLLLLAIVGPIAASGSIAIGAGLTRVAERFPLRVTAACLAAAMVAMAVVFAVVEGSDPNPMGSLRLQRSTSHWLELIRDAWQVAFAYAAAVGLAVRLAFWGLPLRRCVINCVHHRAGDDAALTS